MEYKVKSLEEMPKALSYLINQVDSLKQTVNSLQLKQTGNTPKWMNIEEFMEYHPNRPKKQTVYEWVSKKMVPVHKTTKGLQFLQSEIDEWLKGGSQKADEELELEAMAFINSKKKIGL